MPVPLDVFYRRFCDRFPHHIRQEVATNPKELLMFLKLNRHVFFIRSNKVQLVSFQICTLIWCTDQSIQFLQVRARQPGDELGSESGRSTAEDGSAVGSERSATSPEENGNGANGKSNESCQQKLADIANNNNNNCNYYNSLFPLNRENLHRVQVAQTLKRAQVCKNTIGGCF